MAIRELNGLTRNIPSTEVRVEEKSRLKNMAADDDLMVSALFLINFYAAHFRHKYGLSKHDGTK